MNDIQSKDYAEYLEKTLRELVELPIEGICIVAKMKGSGHFLNFYNSNVTDKVTYAGLIQQDAMIDTLKRNKLIPDNP